MCSIPLCAIWYRPWCVLWSNHVLRYQASRFYHATCYCNTSWFAMTCCSTHTPCVVHYMQYSIRYTAYHVLESLWSLSPLGLGRSLPHPCAHVSSPWEGGDRDRGLIRFTRCFYVCAASLHTIGYRIFGTPGPGLLNNNCRVMSLHNGCYFWDT